MLLLCSCASLYSGRDLKNVPIEALKASEHSVTLRFVTISEHGSQEYFITKSEHYSKEAFDYIRSLNLFQKIELALLPYETVSLKSKESLDELLSTTTPQIDTDYFIDICRFSPFAPHGGGMGTWGGLISFLTLGIVPSWWHNQNKFVIKVFKNNQQVTTLDLQEDYHAFHSTLFHLVPSSDKTFRKSLNEVDKNAIRTILQNLEDRLK